jgi:hypothetical protein
MSVATPISTPSVVSVERSGLLRIARQLIENA